MDEEEIKIKMDDGVTRFFTRFVELSEVCSANKPFAQLTTGLTFDHWATPADVTV